MFPSQGVSEGKRFWSILLIAVQKPPECRSEPPRAYGAVWTPSNTARRCLEAGYLAPPRTVWTCLEAVRRPKAVWSLPETDAEVQPKNSAECSTRQHVTIRPKFGRTSANIRRHLWLRICGVLHSPLALSKDIILTFSY